MELLPYAGAVGYRRVIGNPQPGAAHAIDSSNCQNFDCQAFFVRAARIRWPTIASSPGCNIHTLTTSVFASAGIPWSAFGRYLGSVQSKVSPCAIVVRSLWTQTPGQTKDSVCPGKLAYTCYAMTVHSA